MPPSVGAAGATSSPHNMLTTRGNAFKPAALTVLSFGAGQDSWALAVAYVEDQAFRANYAAGRLLVLMSDTGAEHPETYEFVDYAAVYFARHGVEFHFIRPDMGYHTGAWRGGLYGMYETHSVIGSRAFPMSACTAMLKIRPLYAYLDAWVSRTYNIPGTRKSALKAFANEYGKIDVLIGFSKGEEARAGLSTDMQTAFAFAAEQRSSDPVWMQEAVNKRFPLIELGMDRQACQEYVRAHGEHVPPPSNCMICHWKSDADCAWTRLAYPHQFARWVALEHRKLAAWSDSSFRRVRQRVFTPDGDYINQAVSGRFHEDGSPVLLTERADAAERDLEQRLGLLTPASKLAYLRAQRHTHGHGVRSRAA